MPAQGKPFEVFCSYDPKDEALCLELEKHLSLFQRRGLLALWHHRKIVPGTNWAESIDAHLNQAALILLLISPDFLNSDYCYGVEMTRALQRHETNEARVIPVLLRPSLWKNAPFAHLTALPANARPVSRWRDRDAAFVEIAEGIERAIQELQSFTVATPAGRETRPWNIPFPRNRFFLGRDELLADLRRRLHPDKPLAVCQPQAISGLGGIGKTQLVLEYSYRFADDYQAVLWTRADSRETLLSGFVEFARLLHLPEREERDQAVVIHAVKRWLSQHERWLLVLDNADDLAFLPGFLPVPYSGHIVLTTRAQAVNQLANRMEVDVLEEEEGGLLLLRRAGTLAPDASLEQADDASYLLAQQLCKELGSLPLALDQAGAYIEETQCGLQGYLDLFHQRRSELLRQRGGIVQDHEAVATTWSLSFAAVEQKNAAAADLLRLCAILHPDAIPEELLLRGASSLGKHLGALESDPLALNHALAVLTGYSLVRRTSREQTFSIHRLVQAVLQDTMGKQECAKWVNQAIRALYTTFPDSDHTTWNGCERLLPHALACLGNERLLEDNLSLVSLAYTIALYLYQRARYAEAEPLFQRAIRIRETALGAEHPDVAYPLTNLAILYSKQGKYAEAEPLYQRALQIGEAALGAEHPLTVKVRANYDRFLQRWGEPESVRMVGNKKRSSKKRKK